MVSKNNQIQPAYGFCFDPSQIIPQGKEKEEIWPKGMKYFITPRNQEFTFPNR